MNDKLNDLLAKVRASATVAGEYATKAAKDVGKAASGAYNVSKLNLQIFDLNTDLDVLYKDIGRLIYASHQGKDTPSDELEAKLALADEKTAKIEALRAEIAAHKDAQVCPDCGSVGSREDKFCSKCGAQMPQ